MVQLRPHLCHPLVPDKGSRIAQQTGGRRAEAELQRAARRRLAAGTHDNRPARPPLPAAYSGDRIVCKETNEQSDRLIWYKEPTPESIGEPRLPSPAQPSPSPAPASGPCCLLLDGSLGRDSLQPCRWPP